MPSETLPTIESEALSHVAGGLTSTDQITATLTQITSSLGQLSANKNQTDPTQMLLLMMLMGGLGGGGGGGSFIPPPGGPVAGPPVVNVDTRVSGGRRFGGFRPPCGPTRYW